MWRSPQQVQTDTSCLAQCSVATEYCRRGWRAELCFLPGLVVPIVGSLVSSSLHYIRAYVSLGLPIRSLSF